jgi:threonylcarbamoyladenosine tRNA methylthiotransferase MtaB
VSGWLKTLTLGCKVNQYETQLLREGLLKIGYQDADEETSADLCVVNTCTVTQEGDAKSRQAIRRLHRHNPHARIVVMGCYATRAPDEVRHLPGVSEIILDKRELPDWLGRHGVIDVPRGVRGLDHRSRAYVKVQDGCLLRCSYCIIPYVRPSMHSRPLDEIVAEVEGMVEHGVREIVLTGIHLGHYGVDWNSRRPKHEWTRLVHLLRGLVRLSGPFRIRLSSIEATEVTRELIDVIGEHSDRVCPHLHICLQSGSDDVLRRMRRRWGVQRFVDRCRLVQEKLDLPALTTDVIVGFPGESEDDFRQTVKVCRDIGFSKIHIFPFSPRHGTPAATMPDPIPADAKARRVQVLTDVERELRHQYNRQLLGRELQVLVEASDGHVSTGTSCRYATVDVEQTGANVGALVDVRITTCQTDRLSGEPLSLFGETTDG